MNKTSLGRLERVDLRGIWQSEAGAFTPWLAQGESFIELLESTHLIHRLLPAAIEVYPCRTLQSGTIAPYLETKR